jgi:hypothetical protein
VRQFTGYLSAAAKRRHNERAFEWALTQAQVASMGGELPDFPDYAGSEEEWDPEWIERQLSAHPLVRKVDNRPPPE